MVINYLDCVRPAICPHKTDTPLIVDSNAVLALSFALQCFKPIGWRDSQIIQRLRLIEHEQLAQGNLLNIARRLARHFALPDFLSLS